MSNQRSLLIPLFLILAIAGTTGTYARNRVWLDSVTLWENVVKQSPRKRSQTHTARIFFGLASEMAVRNDLEKALALYRQAIENDPGFVRAHFERALLFARIGDMDHAIGSFRAAIDLIQRADRHRAPGMAARRDDHADLLEKSFNNIGSALFKKGHYHDAIDQYSHAIALNAGYSDAYFHRALGLRQLGKEREAMRDFRTACELGYAKGCEELMESR